MTGNFCRYSSCHPAAVLPPLTEYVADPLLLMPLRVVEANRSAAQWRIPFFVIN